MYIHVCIYIIYIYGIVVLTKATKFNKVLYLCLFIFSYTFLVQLKFCNVMIHQEIHGFML